MQILITGICGFVGSEIAKGLLAHSDTISIIGIDNLSRRGSESNLPQLRLLGIRVIHGDIRSASDLENVPRCDFVIDAAANPSVLAGVDGKSSARQLVEHNLIGSVNLLEYCRRHRAGFILISTSRVYSIPPLASLQVEEHNGAFAPTQSQVWPKGLSLAGISEGFSCAPPVSLYGATKVASETLALEYGFTFDFPVWINRCGVMAGARQFGKADQGIFSYWIHSWRAAHPLEYIGFRGNGAQVRDAFHPRDLVEVVLRQSEATSSNKMQITNFGGGIANAMSLAQLSDWCTDRFGPRQVQGNPVPRPFDLPWVVLDSAQANTIWNWRPQRTLDALLEEIAEHAEAEPNWLEYAAA